MNDGLFPLRSLPWQSGIKDGSAPSSESSGFGPTDDWQEIRLMLRTCGA